MFDEVQGGESGYVALDGLGGDAGEVGELRDTEAGVSADGGEEGLLAGVESLGTRISVRFVRSVVFII